MTVKPLCLLGSVIAVMVLCACSHNPVTPKSYPPIVKIAIVPVLEPAGYSLRNMNLAVALLGIPAQIGLESLQNEKANRFSVAMIRQHPKPGAKLLTRLADDLTRSGYQVEIIEKIERGTDDPDDIDYATIKTGADAILHVRFTASGVYSGAFNGTYVPRLNVRGVLYAPNRDDTVYEEDLYYGVDAREGKPWAIVADAKYSYPDFDTLIAGIPDIVSGFESGSQAIADRMVEHIKNTVK
jgi:hypothetical protein